jgi:hypothetical protein
MAHQPLTKGVPPAQRFGHLGQLAGLLADGHQRPVQRGHRLAAVPGRVGQTAAGGNLGGPLCRQTPHFAARAGRFQRSLDRHAGGKHYRKIVIKMNPPVRQWLSPLCCVPGPAGPFGRLRFQRPGRIVQFLHRYHHPRTFHQAAGDAFNPADDLIAEPPLNNHGDHFPVRRSAVRPASGAAEI